MCLSLSTPRSPPGPSGEWRCAVIIPHLVAAPGSTERVGTTRRWLRSAAALDQLTSPLFGRSEDVAAAALDAREVRWMQGKSLVLWTDRLIEARK